MGNLTSNNYFYLPDIGAHGETEKTKYDNAMKATDAAIAGIKKNVDEGRIFRKTTAEIETIVASDTDEVRIFFNQTRSSLELWVGGKFGKPL